MVTLTWRAQSALLLGVFVIATGYGFLLPVLPLTIERIEGSGDPALASHTGLLTGIYTLALFVFAPLWGRLADTRGRRPVLLLGLTGFAVTLTLFAFADNLLFLYFGRLLNGLFAAAITPAAYALIGDHALSKEWRAHRYALINIAGAFGFLFGPMLGSFSVEAERVLLPNIRDAAAFRAPFLFTSVFAFLVALIVWALVPGSTPAKTGQHPIRSGQQHERGTLLRLLAISFVAATAVGVFEVGLSLRGIRELGMTTSQLGLLFSECSLVMLVVQSLVFSPLVSPETTRLFFVPNLFILAIGLILVPLSTIGISMSISVAMVAASAGVLSPISTYWVSLGAREFQGTELGGQTAAASLGQALGSTAGGLFFNIAFLPNASFIVAAALSLATLAVAIGLPRLLSRMDKQISDVGSVTSP